MFPENLIMRDALTGEEVTRMPLGETLIARFGVPYAVTHRADLHATLLKACQAQPLISLRNNAKVTTHTDSGSATSVTLADGERIDGAAIIACDGLW